MAIRIVEIVQASCSSCIQMDPIVARINAECGNPIEKVDGRAPAGSALAGRYGISTTPTFLFIEGDREVRPRIANVVPYEQLRAAVVSAGRCAPGGAPATPPVVTPPPPTSPPGGIPGGGYTPPAAPPISSTAAYDVEGMPMDLKVEVLRALAFSTSRTALDALAANVAARGFSRAARRLRAIAVVV